MKRLFIATLILISATSLAQNRIMEQIHRLATPDGSVRSTVVLDNESRAVLSAVKGFSQIKGFRICIFFDSGQDARTKGEHTRVQFAKSYPGIESNFSHENPHFRVYVGNYISRAEANKELSKIRVNYPSAFIAEYQIPISLLSAPKPEIIEENHDTAVVEESD